MLYLVTKIFQLPCLNKIALYLLKSGFLTLLIFNIFNICFSAGIHWKHGSSQDYLYSIDNLLIAVLIISVIG
jgi:hypothetical protein